MPPGLSSHENHEAGIDEIWMHSSRPVGTLQVVPSDRLAVRSTAPCGIHLRRPAMKWETPTASDMRFGFEITMYIANR
jgi:pyrroloquinoline quinone biosynthesis protein A